MKSRSLIMITAALITTAAILLTAGLSLLHGAAFNEATVDEAPIATKDEVIDVTVDETVEEVADTATEDEAPVVDEPAIEEPVVEAPKYDYPDYEYTVGDARDFYYCGCNQDNPYTSHYELLPGVVIDIYSHQTGELVGQLALESREIENYISKLVEEEFNPWAQTSDVYKPEEALDLPYGKYRIEVYSGTWFSYTYGDDSMYELTQCTATFYGGEKMIGYINYLIDDYIAELEAGNVAKPDPEMAVSKLVFCALEGYWYGQWIEGTWYEPDYWWEGAGRFTERFPYLED